jgi:hypothetical protein
MESAAIHSSEVHEVDSEIPMTLLKVFSTSPSLLFLMTSSSILEEMICPYIYL